ncbi:hypothetical protein PanWU01x14_351610, partial [Parasponia andersonii]
KKYILRQSGLLHQEYLFADKLLSTLIADEILHRESLLTFGDAFFAPLLKLESVRKDDDSCSVEIVFITLFQ